MKKHIILLAIILLPSLCIGKQYKEIILQIDICEKYIVRETDKYDVTLVKEMPLRFSNVQVRPKLSRNFDIMLYFKCDSADLSMYNSPEKIKNVLVQSSRKYLPYSVETELKLKEANWKGQYGYYAIFTDKKLVHENSIPLGQFKYITRGMVRIAEDAALGFSIMTNEVNTDEYKELLSYIQGFIKKEKKEC